MHHVTSFGITNQQATEPLSAEVDQAAEVVRG